MGYRNGRLPYPAPYRSFSRYDIGPFLTRSLLLPRLVCLSVGIVVAKLLLCRRGARAAATAAQLSVLRIFNACMCSRALQYPATSRQYSAIRASRPLYHEYLLSLWFLFRSATCAFISSSNSGGSGGMAQRLLLRQYGRYPSPLCAPLILRRGTMYTTYLTRCSSALVCMNCTGCLRRSGEAASEQHNPGWLLSPGAVRGFCANTEMVEFGTWIAGHDEL